MKQPQTKQSAQELTSEAAPRWRDPMLSAYLGIVPNEDALLRDKAGGDIALYRDLKNDAQVFSCLQKRIHSQICRPWSVVPVRENEGDDAVAERITAALESAGLNAACAALLDALLTGFAVVEIVWQYDAGAWIPAQLIQRATRRFVWVQDEGQPLQLRLLTRDNLLRGEPLPPRKFIVHQCQTADGNPLGDSLGRQLYWPVYFKKRAVVAWNKLNDRFGSPTPWGRYPRNASAEEKRTLEAALRAFSNDGYVSTPEGTLIELLESSLSGNVTSQKELCTYMDDAISAVILGTEPRNGSGGAQAAAAKEREDVRLDLTAADAELLCDTLNKTLLRWMCDLNGWPRYLLTRTVKSEVDRESEARADAIVAGMGYRLTLDAVREKYGEGWEVTAPTFAPASPEASLSLTAPRGGADVLEAARRTSGAAPTLTHEAESTDFASAAEAQMDAVGDAIDAAVDAELAHWQTLAAPLVDPLQSLLDHAAAEGWTAARLIAALPDVLPQLDTAPLAHALARAAAHARADGAAE